MAACKVPSSKTGKLDTCAQAIANSQTCVTKAIASFQVSNNNNKAIASCRTISITNSTAGVHSAARKILAYTDSSPKVCDFEEEELVFDFEHRCERL
ncbi:hypothetical protein KCU85_g1752, partial [Aureobasidium melanogenum]